MGSCTAKGPKKKDVNNRIKLRGVDKYQRAFKDIAFCGHCGRPLVGDATLKKKKLYIYYVCHANKHGDQTEHCELVSIPVELFEHAWASFWNSIAAHPSVLRKSLETAGAIQKTKRSELKKTLKQIEADKEACEKQLSNLVRNLTKVTSKPAIERISEEIEILDSTIKTKASEIYILKQQQENLKQLDPESEVLAQQLADFSAIFGRLTHEEKKLFLRHTVEKIIVKQFDPKKAVQLTSKHQIVALRGKKCLAVETHFRLSCLKSAKRGTSEEVPLKAKMAAQAGIEPATK